MKFTVSVEVQHETGGPRGKTAVARALHDKFDEESLFVWDHELASQYRITGVSVERVPEEPKPVRQVRSKK